MIRLSDTAIQEVKRLKSKHLHGVQGGVLQINIQPKGCAGLSYELIFLPQAHLENQVFDCGDIRVAVHSTNLPYVDGLTLDYSEDLMGGSFRFHNPNAKQTCSCGHSFALEAAS